MIVAVGDEFPRSDVAVGAGDVLNDDRLLPTRRQSLGEQARNNIEPGARRVRHDHADRPLRPG
jgi:hypothetical protein